MKRTTQDSFDAGLILAGLSPGARSILAELSVLDEVDSTNNTILAKPVEDRHACAVIADHQTEGRGRRQRSWHSPPGGNIYLSLGWRFDQPAWPLSTLPLIVALTICKALDQAGLKGHGVKWPNDILAGGKKLAGVLVEMQSAGNGPALAVIGIGLNVCMPMRDAKQLATVINRPWTDFHTELAGDQAPVSRNELTAWLLNELIEALVPFEKFGFEIFREAWTERDILQGKRIVLNGKNGQLAGIARGIDRDGGLLLETENEGVRVFHSGEVSINRG